MPDVQQFIIAPDKRAQGSNDDLAAFVTVAKSHPDVTVLKEGPGFATISALAPALDALMASHGSRLMREVDAALQMPEPPGPVINRGPLQTPTADHEADPRDTPDDDNFL